MADWLKIAIKTALVATIMAAILVLFTQVKIPSVDFSVLSGISTFFAVMYHWLPIMQVVWPVVLALLAFEIALLTTKLTLVGVRWIMKINE